eukprot:822789_1
MPMGIQHQTQSQIHHSQTLYLGLDVQNTKKKYAEKKHRGQQRMKLVNTYHKTRFKGDPKCDMRIFVKTLTGKTYTIQCRTNDFLGTIKMLLEKQSGIPHGQQRLLFAGKQPRDYYTLSDVNIQQDSTLHVVLKLRSQTSDDKKSNAEDEMYTKLIEMNFGDIAARNAAKLFPNDLSSAVTAVLSQTANNAVNVNGVKKQPKVAKKEDPASPQKYVERQFYEFLKEINLEKYFDQFKENDCADMESIRYFDDDILKKDIGMKNTMARKKFIGKCRDMMLEMNSFKDEYGLSSVLYKKLIRYGIITMDILCMTVERKEDLKNVYHIEHEDDVNTLCNLMKQHRKNQKYQMEGNEQPNNSNETAYI